ncbi:MAG: hypothetical protein M3Y24_13280 [Acidobacteriota bacterium]|nr:hypothetical protein [Acidobacteriota bacterium]
MGNKNRAILYLQQAFESHDINLVVLNIDSSFAQMRGYPAFRQIVERVGIASQSPVSANLQ